MQHIICNFSMLDFELIGDLSIKILLYVFITLQIVYNIEAECGYDKRSHKIYNIGN